MGSKDCVILCVCVCVYVEVGGGVYVCVCGRGHQNGDHLVCENAMFMPNVIFLWQLKPIFLIVLLFKLRKKLNVHVEFFIKVKKGDNYF